MVSRKVMLYLSAKKKSEEYQKQLDEWERERKEREKAVTEKLKSRRIPKYMQRFYQKEEERKIEEAKTPEEIDLRKEIAKHEALKKIFKKGTYKEIISEGKMEEITDCGKTIDELIESIKNSRFVTDKSTDKPVKDASYEDLRCLMKYAKENPKEASKIYSKLLEGSKSNN